MKSDIVIIGGGIIGSAAAYFLAKGNNAGSVTVIEPDNTYARASTPSGAGGVRRLMSKPENIRMSQFSLDFYASFTETMSSSDHPVDIQFRRQGYLFLTNSGGVDDLVLNFKTQVEEGVPVQLLDRDALRLQFPSIGLENVALACYSPGDGWIDPHAALNGFRHQAETFGAVYIQDRVVELGTSNSSVKHAQLESGRRITGDIFINSAGAWANDIATMTHAKLPVVPMCRAQHYWCCNQDIEPLPLIKDDSGVFLRPEGNGFVGGRPSWDIDPGFIWDVDRGYFANYFEDTVWELVAGIIPRFESIKLERSWLGHYAQNLFDGNMIIGRYSNRLNNIFTACGFSGHGIMHAPAVGRALSELVLYGKFQSIDLDRMGFKRVLENQPYPELGIK